MPPRTVQLAADSTPRSTYRERRKASRSLLRIRVQSMLPRDLNDRLEDVLLTHGGTKDGFVADAVKEKLDRQLNSSNRIEAA